jgi:hypothetical protein
MYTANLSENLKKSDQQSKRVTIRFNLPNPGCDTTSSFFGIGKKTVLKTLKDNIDEFADLNKLCLLDSDNPF